MPEPMPYTEAHRLLHPLRGLIISPNKLASRMSLKPDATVLELGPGPGYYSPGIARAIPHGKLILVDVQPEMLDMARIRLAEQGIDTVEFRQGDASYIPADSDSIDAVLLASVLGEVPDRLACLREISRILKSDGVLTITEFKIRDPDFIPKDEMIRIAESAGLKVAKQYGGLFAYTLSLTKSK